MNLHAFIAGNGFSFPDFRRKYPPPRAKSEQVRLFVEKLKQKKKTPHQSTPAAHTISPFLRSQELNDGAYPSTSESKSAPPVLPVNRQPEAQVTNRYADNILCCLVQLEATIAEPSPSATTKDGSIYELKRLTVDVKGYITYLALESRVAGFCQNQAFNVLLFLFRHVLKKDFEDNTMCLAQKVVRIPLPQSSGKV